MVLSPRRMRSAAAGSAFLISAAERSLRFDQRAFLGEFGARIAASLFSGY
jgi:hypothetical protein